MNTLKVLLLVCAIVLSAVAQAQGLSGDKTRREALNMGLYPPDMIMRHQQRLGITAEQRASMAAAVREFQSAVAELQWNLQSEQQALEQMLAGYEVNSDDALAQVDKVLALENDFKRAHFSLLITIKNQLTEAQIDMIRAEIKKRVAAAKS